MCVGGVIGVAKPREIVALSKFPFPYCYFLGALSCEGLFLRFFILLFSIANLFTLLVL